ncbi:hypothetical protein NDU88_000716 [Pleurodeles waltl]|uniref:Uncharacterized protein n=1 Tax=Pleurodeles waltl TaxID=8319 RepID=A0AAV7TFR2_PLEWA|nr:hypothetical protein NDU88_000716 [Pleurodeles waltl]
MSSGVNPDQEEKSKNRREWEERALGALKEERTEELNEQEKVKGGTTADDRTEATATETLQCELSAREDRTPTGTSHIPGGTWLTQAFHDGATLQTGTPVKKKRETL